MPKQVFSSEWSNPRRVRMLRTQMSFRNSTRDACINFAKKIIKLAESVPFPETLEHGLYHLEFGVTLLGRKVPKLRRKRDMEFGRGTGEILSITPQCERRKIFDNPKIADDNKRSPRRPRETMGIKETGAKQ
jgi:hypothetical protein